MPSARRAKGLSSWAKGWPLKPKWPELGKKGPDLCLPHGDRGKRSGKPAFPTFPLTHRGLTGALATRCNPQTQGLLRGLKPHLFLQVRPVCARLPTQPRGLRGLGDR